MLKVSYDEEKPSKETKEIHFEITELNELTKD